MKDLKQKIKKRTKNKGAMYMNNAKFIIVQDEETARKLIESGFNLVSNMNGTYTFMNITPQHFSFENIDIKKLAYTNVLTF